MIAATAPAAATRRRALGPVGSFLWVALPAGLLFAAIFPPFAAPDEHTHFYRSYAISKGDLLPSRQGGALGSVLPASVPALVWELAGDLPNLQKTSPGRILAAFARPLKPEQQEFVDYRTSGLVSPLPYLPQAAAIAAGRLTGLPPLATFYSTRLANLICSSLLIALAIRRMPAQRWLVTLVALLPMAVSLRASASADALTMAFAFVFVAMLAYLAGGDQGNAANADWWLMTASAVALCLTKPVYFPLALAPALIPANYWPGQRKWLRIAAHLTAVSLAIAAALWIAGRADVSVRPDAAVDRAAQLDFVLDQPLRFGGLLVADYTRHAARYVAQGVGIQMGWLDVRLPLALVAIYCAWIGVLWLTHDGDGDEPALPPVSMRLGLLGLVAAVLVLVSLSQYLIFTPLRAAAIDGIQGRYFLPLVPAMLLACGRRSRRGVERAVARRSTSVVLGTGVGLLIAAYYIIDRYWI